MDSQDTSRLKVLGSWGSFVIVTFVLLVALPPVDVEIASSLAPQPLPLLPLLGLTLPGVSLLGRMWTRPKKQNLLNPTRKKELRQRLLKLEEENAALQKQLHKTQEELENTIAAEKMTRAIQNASMQRFHTLFQDLPFPSFTVNEIGHIVEWNQAAAGFFGVEAYRAVDQPIANILGHDVFRGHAQDAIYKVFLGYRPDPTDVNVPLKSGETRRVKWFVSPVRNEKGQIVGAVNTLGVMPAQSSAQTDRSQKAA